MLNDIVKILNGFSYPYKDMIFRLGSKSKLGYELLISREEWMLYLSKGHYDYLKKIVSNDKFKISYVIISSRNIKWNRVLKTIYDRL